MLAVVVVNSLTLAHYKRTDLGYLFVANYHYRLICKLLIFATFSVVGMGSAYTPDGLYASVHGWNVIMLAIVGVLLLLFLAHPVGVNTVDTKQV